MAQANNLACWLTLQNSNETPLQLLIEPYGIAYEMPPHDYFYVYASERDFDMPMIEFKEDFVVIYASQAVVYHERKKVFDFSVQPVPEPTFHDHPK